MKEITIKISDKKAKLWNYYLSLQYGKKKSLNTKCELALLQKVAVLATIESEYKVSKIIGQDTHWEPPEND
jgi:hypothetical protein